MTNIRQKNIQLSKNCVDRDDLKKEVDEKNSAVQQL